MPGTPIAAWNFDAGSGSTISGNEGTSSTLTVGSGSFTGSGHTGAGFQNVTGSATTGASGTVPAVTGAACTLMAWVNPSTLAAGGTHLICGALDSGASSYFNIWSQRGDFSTANVLQGNARLGGGVVPVNGTALTAGTWAHIAMTYDGFTLKLWLNATMIASVANTNTVSNVTTFYVAGHASEGTARTTVDDVRYFNTDESASMSTWMATPVPGPVVADTSSFFEFF